MRQLIDMNTHMEAYQKTLVEIANDLAREEVIVRLVPFCSLKYMLKRETNLIYKTK